MYLLAVACSFVVGFVGVVVLFMSVSIANFSRVYKRQMKSTTKYAVLLCFVLCCCVLVFCFKVAVCVCECVCGRIFVSAIVYMDVRNVRVSATTKNRDCLIYIENFDAAVVCFVDLLICYDSDNNNNIISATTTTTTCNYDYSYGW